MAEAQPGGRPPWWLRHWLALTVFGLIVLLAYAVLAPTVLPGWVVSLSGSGADENHHLDAIANARGALLGVLAPVVVAIGAVAALLNYRVAATNLAETAAQNRRTVELNRDTPDLTRRGQLTERFTKAIDQLGQIAGDKLDIRLGGIYALEQTARESKELHGPVIEILTAFLREHSRKQPETPVASEAADPDAVEEMLSRPRADFQAIVTVLGRREVSNDPEHFSLDLRGVVVGRCNFWNGQLQGADFTSPQLQGADFTSAQLQGTRFEGAQLKGAYFNGAQLQGAYFGFAQLQGARFNGAQLQGAHFFSAQLQSALFWNAQLHDATFANADIEGAEFDEPANDDFEAAGLTLKQLREAKNVDKAILPGYLQESRPEGPPAREARRRRPPRASTS